MKKLLATGLTGLVGSRFAQDFGSAYSIDSLATSDPHNPTDITDFTQVQRRFAATDADVVIHLAGYTDVTGAWEQRGDKSGSAYISNVIGTQNIIRACQETGKHLIHVSTAYVFDGEKDLLYLESDPVHPIEWYGQTKSEAEALVQQATCPWTIFRIDQPFRTDAVKKPDIVRKIKSGLVTQTLKPQFTNHFFGPTFLNNFAKVLDWAVRTRTTGLFHASSGEQWSDFLFAETINEIFALGATVLPGDLDVYLQTLNRPYQRNTAMSTEKLTKALDFTQVTVREALQLCALAAK